MTDYALDVRIQTHPSRLARAIALMRQIEKQEHDPDEGTAPVTIQVMQDPDPDSPLRSPWRSAQRCWRAPASAPWKLVLQDDVILCDGFLGKVLAALAEKRDSLVTFYVGRYPNSAARNVVAALESGSRWADIELENWTPCLALAMPSEWGYDLAAYTDRRSFPPGFVADDAIISHWRQEMGHRACWATVPSLVDHDNGVPSLMMTDANTQRMAIAIDPTLPERPELVPFF